MPTGYTADIKDGITFEQFALTCARGMGALIMMRDEPMNAPIPEFQPGEYYKKALAECQARAFTLETMTERDADAEAAKAHAASVTRHKERVADRLALRHKYEAMAQQVEAWTPPTPDHQGLKRFMAEQIAESVRFDCAEFSEDVPQPRSGAAWLATERAEVARQMSYLASEHAKDIERTAERNAWVKALRESLSA